MSVKRTSISRKSLKKGVKAISKINNDKYWKIAIRRWSYMKYLKNDFKSYLKQRINHVLLLMTKLDNKLTNVDRSYIFNKLKVLKQKYVRTRNRNIRMQVIERTVKITNDLYNKQKQNTRLLHDLAYFGVRDLKYLVEEDNNDYEAIFVKSALDGRF